MNSDLQIQLLQACSSGDLEGVKSLLSGAVPAQLVVYKEKSRAKPMALKPSVKKGTEERSGESPAFIEACSAGHSHIVSYLLTAPDLPQIPYNLVHHEGFKKACANKHIKVLDILINQDASEPFYLNKYKTIIFQAIQQYNNEVVYYLLTHHPFDIHLEKEAILFVACAADNKEMVHYLLTSPDLKEHANINTISANGQTALMCACRYGYKDLAAYLLTSPELKDHADIHAVQDGAIALACNGNHMDVVKYLLTSPSLTDHANIHAYNEDDAFKQCILKKHTELLQYLILKYEIEKTPEIAGFLFKQKNQPAYKELILSLEEKFAVTEFKHRLENDLSNNKESSNLNNSERIQRKIKV